MLANDICKLSVRILDLDLETLPFPFFRKIIDVILEDQDNLLAIMDLQFVL
jgi:hypothetical protein